MSQTPEEKQYFYCCDSCACDPGSEYIHITEYQILEKRISELETEPLNFIKWSYHADDEYAGRILSKYNKFKAALTPKAKPDDWKEKQDGFPYS